MNGALAPECLHPADAPAIPDFTVEKYNCDAHWCPRCRQWFRMSADRPAPRTVYVPKP